MARLRAGDLTNSFLATLLDTNANAFGSAADPDFQHILFLAQQTYARSGEQEILDILVNLLVERASSSEPTFLRVAQNEACVAISKLTYRHFNALSLLFLIKNIGVLHTNRLDILIPHFRTEIRPLLEKLPDSQLSYEYLENLGCVIKSRTLPLTNRDREGEYEFIISDSTLFNMRLTKDEVEFLILEGNACVELFELEPPSYPKPRYFFIHGTETEIVDVHNGPRIPIEHRTVDEEAIRKLLYAKQLSASAIEDAVRKYVGLMGTGDKYVVDLIISIEPNIAKLLDVWSYVQHYSLTAVGIVIAISNLKRLTGEVYNILKWIK